VKRLRHGKERYNVGPYIGGTSGKKNNYIADAGPRESSQRIKGDRKSSQEPGGKKTLANNTKT